MKPRLAIGLGNPLMGDDGVGWYIAESLAEDLRLPSDVEVMQGGTDLLRCGDRMQERTRIFLIDAMQSDSAPGTISVIDTALDQLMETHENAHQLSVASAVKLLGLTISAPFTILAIAIPAVRAGHELSSSMSLRMPAMVERVLQELGRV